MLSGVRYINMINEEKCQWPNVLYLTRLSPSLGHGTYFTRKLPWTFSFWSERSQNEFFGCVHHHADNSATEWPQNEICPGGAVYTWWGRSAKNENLLPKLSLWLSAQNSRRGRNDPSRHFWNCSGWKSGLSIVIDYCYSIKWAKLTQM